MTERTFHARVDDTTPDEWAQMLDLFSDANVYQSWPYGEVRWGRQALSHLVLYQKGQVVAMAQLRIAPRWKVPCGIAYLRWGPLYVRKQFEADPAILPAMVQALHSEYTVKRGLFLRILPNAFADTPRGHETESAFHNFRRESFAEGTTYRSLQLDLQPSLVDLRKALDQKWRNQLNRAEKNNLKIVEGAGRESFETFLRLHDEMLARKKFAVFSDLHEYVKMQELLPERHRFRILICEENGVPVSGVVATAMGDTGIYLLGATSDKGMTAKGAYLLQWEMIRWLKTSGYRYYNLGGINPVTNPGVYHFKSGLSGADLQYVPPYTKCQNTLSKIFVGTGESLRNAVRLFKLKKAKAQKKEAKPSSQ